MGSSPASDISSLCNLSLKERSPPSKDRDSAVATSPRPAGGPDDGGSPPVNIEPAEVTAAAPMEGGVSEGEDVGGVEEDWDMVSVDDSEDWDVISYGEREL